MRGILLTGGASRRLGTDKATLVLESPTFDGRTLAQCAGETLRVVAHDVVEVGPGLSGLPAVWEEPRGSGPLAAVAAGLEALAQRSKRTGGQVLVLAVDMPDANSQVLEAIARHRAPRGAAVVPVVNVHRQPLCARYPFRETRAAAAEVLARGQRSMHALLDELPVVEMSWPETRIFADIDTPEDLERYRTEHLP